MPLVMLRRDATTTFRRCVRDSAGQILHTLEFEPGQPAEVSWEHLPAIRNDLFVVLNPVRIDATGKAIGIDRSEFDQLVTETELDAATSPKGLSAVEPVNNVAPDNKRNRK